MFSRALAAICALTFATPVVAQQGFGTTGFGSGSFGGQPAGGQQSTGTQAPSGGNFGGSFGGSFGTAGGDQSAAFGGSFSGTQAAPDTSTVQQGTTPAPPPPPPPPTNRVDPQIQAFETRDFGIPISGNLRQGQFHAPTPLEMPGAYLLTTQGLVDAADQQIRMVLLDVLGGQYTIPGAINAQGLGEPGSFEDRTQQQAAQWLRQLTGGDPQVPIIVFCSDPMCWISYNAGLRVVAAGYENVYWYRGGLRAWQMAGLTLQPSGL